METGKFYIVITEDPAFTEERLAELSLQRMPNDKHIYLFNNSDGLGIWEVFSLFSFIKFVAVKREAALCMTRKPYTAPNL